MADKKGAATFVISLPEYAWCIGKGGGLHLCATSDKHAAVGDCATRTTQSPLNHTHLKNCQSEDSSDDEQMNQIEVDSFRFKAESLQGRICGMYNDFATDDRQTEYNPYGGNEEQKRRPEQKSAGNPARRLRRRRVGCAFPEEALTRLKRPGRLGIIHKS